MKLKTLFICFYFPPFNRVGGRRWAKHLKYFQKFGEDFFVLAGDYDTKSPWDDDIKSYQEKIMRVPVSIYSPYYKRLLPKNTLQKIFWKMSLWHTSFLEKNYKGNFWDTSRDYVAPFLEQAEKIIQEKEIQHICLTVGPFKYASILPELKRKHPHLKITIDYRDYWEDGFGGLRSPQKKAEINLQNCVIKSVDLVLAPNKEMCTHFKSVYDKVTYCLPHCIDEDYLSASNNFHFSLSPQKHFTIVYGGSLYDNMENYVIILIRLIKSIQRQGYSIKLKIYTMLPAYIELFNEYGIDTELHTQVSSKQFIHIAQAGDLLILLRPDWSPNAFSTKFFEYIALRKPVLYIGPKGEVSDFIVNYRLGFTLDAENVEQISHDIIKNRTINEIPDRTFNLQKYTFEYQTKLLIQHFNDHCSNN